MAPRADVAKVDLGWLCGGHRDWLSSRFPHLTLEDFQPVSFNVTIRLWSFHTPLAKPLTCSMKWTGARIALHLIEAAQPEAWGAGVTVYKVLSLCGSACCSVPGDSVPLKGSDPHGHVPFSVTVKCPHYDV